VERLVVTAFGVTVAVQAPRDFPVQGVLEGLPPDYRRRLSATAAPHLVRITRDGPDGYAVDPDNQPPHGPLPGWIALMSAQSALELTVAQHAPDRFFVHAAVVAVDGRAIVLPGSTMSGKSTLTLALVAAGATYLSDEFAVFDGSGRVHPYARPIAMRHGPSRYVPVEAAPPAPVSVALVAHLRFDEQAGWAVGALSPAGAALALLSQSATATARPEATLEALTRAVSGAQAVVGTRGDAAEAASHLLRGLGNALPDQQDER
jgi:hypothetical protein